MIRNKIDLLFMFYIIAILVCLCFFLCDLLERTSEKRLLRETEAIKEYVQAKRMMREQPQCDGCQVEFQAQIDLALERHDLRTYVEDHVHCVKMKSVSIDGLISKLEVTAIDNGSIDPGCSEIDLKKLRKALVELKVFEK